MSSGKPFEVVLCCFLSGIAVICLWRPRVVRDFALRTTPKFHPMRRFMEHETYIWLIRLCGLNAILIFLMILFGLIRVT